ncbi:MAG: hypothetical protein KY396_09565, partial [Actinobacteria bacterium]|nr:hypothetical protein [Actinomycetota bacterium]
MAEPMLASDTASSGVAELDAALGGIYWGDNVVWQLDEGASADPFYAAIGATAASYHGATFVTASRPPSEVDAHLPGLSVVDARPGTPLAEPAPLLAAVTQISRPGRRDLILFDSLDTFAERWGAEAAVRFFTRTCPM